MIPKQPKQITYKKSYYSCDHTNVQVLSSPSLIQVDGISYIEVIPTVFHINRFFRFSHGLKSLNLKILNNERKFLKI